MTTATAEPLTRAAIDQFLAQLTESQRKYVFVKLSGPVCRPIKETRVVLDEHGNLLGDFVPVRPVPPGTKIGMSDEARAALAGKTITRPEPEVWRALLKKKPNAAEGSEQ